MATEKDAAAFEAAVNKLENRLEAGVINWVRNDQVFNGFRNTPARILLWLMSVSVLYWLGWGALKGQGVLGYVYPIAIALMVLMQKLSVRFVFDDESVIDEYQKERRNRAYRRAYKRIGAILSLAILLLAAKESVGVTFTSQTGFWPLPDANLNVMFSVYDAYVVLVFLIGLFTLQKYLSWGFRGEPLN